MKLGLVLTGGGARAAYQAGALRALSEVCGAGSLPFKVIAGVSAGAINGTFLASQAQNFRLGAQKLWDIWATIRPEDVFRTDSISLGRTGLRWLSELSLGGLVKAGKANHLLDTAPLRVMMASLVDFAAIRRNVVSGVLHGVAVSATNYHTGIAITFYDGHPSIEPWMRSSRSSQRSPLCLEHVLASTAIPVFFPPVPLNGSFYGDGCVRLATPLSPAIHLGADQILSIGIRYYRPEQEAFEMNQVRALEPPSLADISGVLLNAVFLDSLETDIERMQRINRTVQLIPEDRRTTGSHRLRAIPVTPLRPSRDLGHLASELFAKFPRTIKHLLRGIGASSHKGGDLLSYLAFDASFTVPLLELGYADAMARKDEIEHMLT